MDRRITKGIANGSVAAASNHRPEWIPLSPPLAAHYIDSEDGHSVTTCTLVAASFDAETELTLWLALFPERTAALRPLDSIDVVIDEHEAVWVADKRRLASERRAG